MPQKRTPLLKIAGRVLLFIYVIPIAILTALHFPYDVDPVEDPAASAAETGAFYDAAYTPSSEIADEYESRYESIAEEGAESFAVEPMLRSFVEAFQLQDKKVLEVGSGDGRWQDLVDDYTGLDISGAVAKNYHKPFVQASATAMPFPDNSFDAIWTVWVLEHIPNPEQCLKEMRRVLKDGGVMCLGVAWHCDPWLADGYPVRPYSDFNLWGKVVKATVPLQANARFKTAYLLPIRYLRLLDYTWNGADTPLRHRALEPNYETYWMEDSDAAVWLDSYEVFLWFHARGDEGYQCKEPLQEVGQFRNPLVIRVNKGGEQKTAQN